jgi:hypothetical protein
MFAGFKISARARPVRFVGGPGAGRAKKYLWKPRSPQPPIPPLIFTQHDILADYLRDLQRRPKPPSQIQPLCLPVNYPLSPATSSGEDLQAGCQGVRPAQICKGATKRL